MRLGFLLITIFATTTSMRIMQAKAQDEATPDAIEWFRFCFDHHTDTRCEDVNKSFKMAVSECISIVPDGSAAPSKDVTHVDVSYNGETRKVGCGDIIEHQVIRANEGKTDKTSCDLSSGKWNGAECESAVQTRKNEAAARLKQLADDQKAISAEKEKSEAACKSFNSSASNYAFLENIGTTAVEQRGSGYTMCSAATGGKFIAIAKSDNETKLNQSQFSGLWGDTKKQYADVKAACKKEPKDAGVDEKIKALDEAIKTADANFKECVVIAAVISYAAKEYDDDKDLLSMEKAISADGQITCTRGTGAESQDFPGCVSMITAYDGFFVSEYALNAAQPLLYQSEMSKSQIEHSKPVGTDSGAMIAPTAGLKIQKDSLDSQSDMAQQKAAFHATKAAALAGFMNSLPSEEHLIEHCKSKNYKPKDDDITCESVIDKYRSGFLNNTKAKDKVKAAMIKAGVDSAVNMYQKNLLDDQSGKVSGVITAIDQYNPAAYTPAAGENLMLEKCQANPSDPACLNTADSYQGFSGQSFNFTGGGGNTSLSAATPTLDMTQFGDGGATSQSRMAAGPEAVGGLGATADKGPSGIIGTPITGAASSAPGQAQGGGGIALGGAAPPSGSGGGGGEPQAPAPTNPTASKVSYEEGRVSMSGGSGLLANRKKGNEKENPFADLIGKKDGKGGPKGGILNFRDPASEKELGSSDKGLFMRLSESYGKIVTSKRLLEYEQSEK